jgi:hypothetical protein
MRPASRRLGRLATVALALALVAGAGTAFGKPAKRRAAAHKPAPAHAQERSAASTADSSSGDGSGDGSGDSGGDSASATDERSVGEPKGSAAGSKVKTKTYTFGAMDVEGKLKTPQLLYFLNRVKLELDMSAPDKRSFMKELGQSADDKSL